MRITVDYRKLNQVIIKDAYLIPNIEEMFPKLKEAVFYSKLDLSSGFYHVPLDPASQRFTTFGCEFGFFQYQVMPMRLTNAPATFQRLMDKILKEYIDDNTTLAYMDDIIVYSNTIKEHRVHVIKVIEKLKEYGLKIKAKKCK
jgi:hypothetical protein